MRRSRAVRRKRSHSPLLNSCDTTDLTLSNPTIHPPPEIQPEHRCWEPGYSRCKAALFKNEKPLLSISPPSKMRRLGLHIRDSKIQKVDTAFEKPAELRGAVELLEHSPFKWKQGRGWSNAPASSSGWGTCLSAAY